MRYVTPHRSHPHSRPGFSTFRYQKQDLHATENVHQHYASDLSLKNALCLSIPPTALVTIVAAPVIDPGRAIVAWCSTRRNSLLSGQRRKNSWRSLKRRCVATLRQRGRQAPGARLAAVRNVGRPPRLLAWALLAHCPGEQSALHVDTASAQRLGKRPLVWSGAR
jgi:hypothetical protein